METLGALSPNARERYGNLVSGATTTATAAASPGNNARNAVRATTSPGRVPASSKPMKFPLVPNVSASLSGVSVGLSGVASLGVSAVPSPAEDLGAASAARAPRGAHHRSGPDSSKAAAYSHGDLASAVGPGPRAPGVFSSAAAPAKKRRPPRLQLASDNAAPLEDAGTPLLALNGDGANVGACHVVGDAPGTRDLGGLGPAGGFGGTCGGARARRSGRRRSRGGGNRRGRGPRRRRPRRTNRRRSTPSSSSRRRGEARGGARRRRRRTFFFSLSKGGNRPTPEGDERAPGRARRGRAEDRARREAKRIRLILTVFFGKTRRRKMLRFAVRSSAAWTTDRPGLPTTLHTLSLTRNDTFPPGTGRPWGKPSRASIEHSRPDPV